MPTTHEKLKHLRTHLQEAGMQGYILPMHDRFGSEYVPPHARCLEWLTGFTGSAGLAVILPECAAFFTDGRYTLQAEAEVDTTCFSLHNTANQGVTSWLKNHAKNLTIGYDPWVMRMANLKQYQALDSITWSPMPCPFATLWPDRPLATSKPGFVHTLGQQLHPTEQKRQAVEASVQNSQMLLLSDPESINWLLNMRGHDLPHTPTLLCYALLEKQGALWLYVDEEKRDKTLTSHLESHHVTCIPLAQIASHIKQHVQAKQVSLDPQQTPTALGTLLEEAGANVQLEQNPCNLPKACKNPAEIKAITQAHIRDGVTLCRFLHWLEQTWPNAPITEQSAAEKLEAFRAEDPAFLGNSFDTISGFGPHGAIIHYRVTEASNATFNTAGGLYLVDSGAQYEDGTTDVTRTIALGTPTQAQQAHFTAALKGHIALASAHFPEGTTGAALDTLARTALWQQGLDYAHGTGHGVGFFLNVHEGPQSISKHNHHTPLKPGMVLSNEPGYYLQGAYGIRIENLVHVVKSTEHEGFLQFKNLTLAPIDTALIIQAHLTQAERNWLNNYHAFVYQTLAPHLKAHPSVKAWLHSVTQTVQKTT